MHWEDPEGWDGEGGGRRDQDEDQEEFSMNYEETMIGASV